MWSMRSLITNTKQKLVVALVLAVGVAASLGASASAWDGNWGGSNHFDNDDNRFVRCFFVDDWQWSWNWGWWNNRHLVCTQFSNFNNNFFIHHQHHFNDWDD